MIFNARSYKLAKVFSSDITTMLQHIDASITALQPFVRYKPAAKILATLRDNKALLEAHKQKCQVIIDAKGAVKSEGEDQ